MTTAQPSPDGASRPTTSTTGAAGASSQKPAPSTKAQKAEAARKPARETAQREPNTTGWISVLVALGLLALQIYYAINATTIDSGDGANVRSIITFGSLVLGLAGAVLGLVGLAQRRFPRWPSVVGLSIGVYAFTIAVFSWIGGLMNA